MADEQNEKSLIDRLFDGEKVLCHRCGKGYFISSAPDPRKSHAFCCSNCDALINIDPVIDLENI